MSCGIGLIQNAEIHQLKSMVQNIIAQHELISTGKAMFNVFDNFEGNVKQCPSCGPYLNQAKKQFEKLLSDVSTQLIELGNFSMSILDNLSQSNQHGQELKDTIKGLQIKKSQLFDCLTQIELQNQEMKSKVQQMEEILTRADKQIIQIQMVNQQLKKSKILLQNKISAIQGSILEQKKSQINVLQKQLSDLREKHETITNEKQNLQRQVMCLNQELRSQSFLPSQCSLKIESRSGSYKRSPQIKIEGNYLSDQSFDKMPIEEFNMSPALFPTKSSLDQDIGSEKAFNFCIYSPSISQVSLADNLQNQSRIRSANISVFQNKENFNSMNGFNYQDAAQKQQKYHNQTVQTTLSIETIDQGVQVYHKVEKINCKWTTVFSQDKVQESNSTDARQKDWVIDNCKMNSEKKFRNISLVSQKSEPLISKVFQYLSKVCIRNRIKSKNSFCLL